MQTRLLEREQAIRTFNSLASASRTSGMLVCVSGEAGIGKTAFIEHIRSSLPAHRFYWSGCDALLTPRPLSPIFELISDIDASLLETLESASMVTWVSATVFHALEKLDTASILVVEDIHWADNATLDVLKYIARRISFLPCLLCISFRDEEIIDKHPAKALLEVMPAAHTQRIELLPLSLSAVAQIVGTEDADVNRDPDQIYRATGGNPLFVTEMLATPFNPDKWIPASVRDTVASRLQKMPAPLREFIETLAVMPYSIPLQLADVLFEHQLQIYMEQSLNARILEFDSRQSIRFRHELTRLAVLECMSVLRQRECHLTLLSALESTQFATNNSWLVQHAQGALNADKTIDYAMRAATQAASVGAHKEAAEYLARALEFSDNAEPLVVAELHEKWAYETGLTTHMKTPVVDAVRHAIALYREQNKLDSVGKNLRHLARLYWYQGQSLRAEQTALEAIKIFESLGPSNELALAYSMRAQFDMLNDRTDAAITWSDKALALEQTFPNPQVRAHALTNKGSALVLNGEDSGRTFLLQSLQIAKQHNLHEDAARVFTNLSDYLVRFKRLDEADACITEGIQYDVAHDLDSWTYYLVGIQATLRLEQGRTQDAITIAEGVQKLSNQTMLMKLPALIVLGRAQSRTGILQSQQTLERALEHAQTINENQYVIPVRLAMIEHAFFYAEADEASEHFAWFDSIDKSILNQWQLGELWLWTTLLHPTSFAEKIHNMASAFASLKLDRVHKAADAFTKRGMHFMAGLARLSWLYKKQCPAGELTEMLNQAYHSFSLAEANTAMTYVRKMATALGFEQALPKRKRGPYAESKKHPLGLTKKEQAVLKLLTNGATNQAIATSLCRSTRTVENHVSSILSKMNVTNRLQAMIKVQNEPWLLTD